MTDREFSDLVIWCHENPRSAADKIRRLEKKIEDVKGFLIFSSHPNCRDAHEMLNKK